MSDQNQIIGMEIIEDDSFSLDGFQVVRGEFFAHTYEPSITFADCKVYVNTACIRKLSEYDYIQILVNPDQKKLAVRPCSESEKDSFRWYRLPSPSYLSIEVSISGEISYTSPITS